jgi:hypothetical protein
MSLIGKAQSSVLLGVLNATSATSANLSGALITSVSKSGTPIAGSWIVELISDSNVTYLITTSLDTKHTCLRRVYASGTYVDTLITGLTIVIAGSQTAGARSIVTVKDACKIGGVEGDSGHNAMLVGNAMKTVQVRTAAQGAMTTTAIHTDAIDCRGFSGISFHANVTAVTGAGINSYALMGGISSTTSEMAQVISFAVQPSIFVNDLTSTGRKSGPVNMATHPYMGLQLVGSGGANATADIWAILHSNASGEGQRGT